IRPRSSVVVISRRSPNHRELSPVLGPLIAIASRELDADQARLTVGAPFADAPAARSAAAGSHEGIAPAIDAAATRRPDAFVSMASTPNARRVNRWRVTAKGRAWSRRSDSVNPRSAIPGSTAVRKGPPMQAVRPAMAAMRAYACQPAQKTRNAATAESTEIQV